MSTEFKNDEKSRKMETHQTQQLDSDCDAKLVVQNHRIRTLGWNWFFLVECPETVAIFLYTYFLHHNLHHCPAFNLLSFFEYFLFLSTPYHLWSFIITRTLALMIASCRWMKHSPTTRVSGGTANGGGADRRTGVSPAVHSEHGYICRCVRPAGAQETPASTHSLTSHLGAEIDGCSLLDINQTGKKKEMEN